MDDGYADHLREYDRAELAEQRLVIVLNGLKHIGRRYPHTLPMIRSLAKEAAKYEQKGRL